MLRVGPGGCSTHPTTAGQGTAERSTYAEGQREHDREDAPDRHADERDADREASTRLVAVRNEISTGVGGGGTSYTGSRSISNASPDCGQNCAPTGGTAHRSDRGGGVPTRTRRRLRLALVDHAGSTTTFESSRTIGPECIAGVAVRRRPRPTLRAGRSNSTTSIIASASRTERFPRSGQSGRTRPETFS